MRLLLLTATLLLYVPGAVSAIELPQQCQECPRGCILTWDELGNVSARCIDLCETCNGVYLAAKSNPWVATATNLQLRFYVDATKGEMGAYLHEGFGWAVDMGFGIGPFPAGAYTGSIEQIAQAIAASGNAEVTVDATNHKLTFRSPLME